MELRGSRPGENENKKGKTIQVETYVVAVNILIATEVRLEQTKSGFVYVERVHRK